MQIVKFFHEFINDESGQGITEYGAVLAFVAILVAVLFGAARGGLAATLSQSLSSVAKQLNNLNSTAASGGS